MKTRKLISLLVVLSMIATVIVIPMSVSAEAPSIDLGDYLVMGEYYG